MEIHIGDRVADVTLVSKDGNKVQFLIDGVPYDVDIVMAENGSCSILHGGNSYNAELIRSDNGKNYTVNTFYRSYNVDIVDTQAKYLRMRKGGSAGGHNGLANIAEMLGTQDYPRLRVGIGSHVGRGPQVDFVLGKWDEEELRQLPEIWERAVEAVKSFGLAGIERTMTQFNRQ